MTIYILINNLKVPELLCPAGDITRLKAAVDYGADAVYLAGEEFGMRTAATNFGEEDLKLGGDDLKVVRNKEKITVTFHSDKISVSDLLSYILNKTQVKDISVNDVNIEEIIKKMGLSLVYKCRKNFQYNIFCHL